jgi:hypothetical protein
MFSTPTANQCHSKRTRERQRDARRRWRASPGVVVWGALVVVALTLATGGARASESFPRLANIYFGSLGSADLETLARWDLLVLAKRAADVHVNELAELRALNPEATILAHIAVGYSGDHASPPINADLSAKLEANNWWLRDADGERFVMSDGNYLLNMTQDCPRDAGGQRLCDWLPGYIDGRLVETGLWDGVYLDYCIDRVAWHNNQAEVPIDSDLDGVADDPELLDERWRLGMRKCVETLRALSGDDFIIMTNGNNTYYDLCDGDTREDFPEMHGDWYENIMDAEHGYLAFEALYRQPAINIINTIWEGYADAYGPERESSFESELLLGLASTLVYGNGYFSCDGPDHSQMWWTDYYDVDLGSPLAGTERAPASPGTAAPGVELGEHITLRRFERGVAVVNPTVRAQTITLPGAYHDIDSWNGRFYEHAGIRTSVELSHETGELLVGTGVTLETSPAGVEAWTTSGGIKLTWGRVKGALLYSVYREEAREDGTFSPAELIALVGEPCYVDGNVRNGGTYGYSVAPIDEARCEGRRSPATEAPTEPGSGLSTAAAVDDPHGSPALDWMELYVASRGSTSFVSCHPTPATDATTLSFVVSADGARLDARPATLTVFDVAGRVVRRLLDTAVSPGPHDIAWDLRDDSGRRVASGCYLCVLETGGERATAKALVLR